MASFLTDIRPFMLLGDLTELIVASTRQSVDVEVSSEGRILHSETYIPTNGRVLIYNFGDIISPAVSVQSLGDVIISLDDGTKSSAKITVMFCSLSLPSAFVDTNFLTVAQDERETFIDADEILYFTQGNNISTASDYCTVYASLHYERNNTNEVITVEKEVRRCFCRRSIARVDVSPRLFNRDGCTLLSYTIFADHRKMTYRVNSQPHPFVAYFRNCFGLYETAYFWGEVKTSVVSEKKIASVNGLRTCYKADTSYEWEAHSGLINAASVALMTDMARSHEVLIAPMNVKINVLVSDLKLEASNDLTVLSTCTVSFEQAKRDQPLFAGVTDVSCIFDLSFDSSFN